MAITTFEKLPQAVDQLAQKLDSIEQMLLSCNPQTGLSISCKPLTAKELCAFLGISPASLIRWRSKGLIPSLRLGGSIRYDRDAVMRAIEQKKGGKPN